MLTSILVYLILGFVLNWWHPGWIIVVAAAFGCAITSIITNLTIELKKSDKENNQPPQG